MRKNIAKIEVQNVCHVCGKRFEGLSRNYCSMECAKSDGLPNKLQKAWQNIKVHTQ